MTASTANSNGSPEYRPVPVDKLYVSDYNVRIRDRTADLDELARSIATIGLQQPIVVEAKEDRFEVIIGQRRYLAAKQLGMQTIPARVIEDGLTELEAKAMSFSENVQRRDLAPRDKADACIYLREQLGSVRAVAEHIGVTDQTIRKWLQFAAVPESLKSLVDADEISRDVATRIAQNVPDESRALGIATRISEMQPPKEHRDRILQAVEDFPNSSVDAILRRAEDAKVRKEIRFILPEKYEVALARAAAEMAVDVNDIARDATIDWLETRYL